MKPHQALYALALALWLLVAAAAQTPEAPTPASPAPPPTALPQRTAAELEKLVSPIALYSDPLIAVILPASVYPLEIVQAARFIKTPENLAKLDEQPWDENVKAVARIPAAIQKLNDDLAWTVELGEAFLAQQKEVMDMIQTLRVKAKDLGTLATTPEQNVVVKETVVYIEPSDPQVIYVPTYNPYTVYYPPPPAYVGPPPIVTFATGVAIGAIIANNCDWGYGGIYIGGGGGGIYVGGGGGHSDVDIDIDNDINIDRGDRGDRGTQGDRGQKWQPDSSRLSKSGSPGASATAQARGWSSDASRSTTRPSGTGAGARPSTTPSTSRAASSPSPARASPSPSASRPSTSPASYNPSSSSRGSRDSAFGGMSSGSDARMSSSRGSMSRGGGGRGGGGGRR